MINKDNIFKLNSSEDLVNFIFNVECDNSEKISELVRNNVDIFFEVYSTLNVIMGVLTLFFVKLQKHVIILIFFSSITTFITIPD